MMEEWFEEILVPAKMFISVHP